MTDERAALIALIEKKADIGLVREMLSFAAERTAEAEVGTRTGAAQGARNPGRMVRRSGHRGQSAKDPPVRPVYGSGTVLDEDAAAYSFGPEDVRSLIKEAGIEPLAEPVFEDIAGRLEDAVTRFILFWRWSTSSPPGKTARWARDVAERARAFLEIMCADPDTGTWPGGFDFDIIQVLVRPVRDSNSIPETPKAAEIRDAMARHPMGLFNNVGIQNLVEELMKQPDVFIPLPATAIQLALEGTAYVAQLATASAEHFDTLKGRTRKALTALDGFVADLNAIYRAIFGREGAVTTDAYEHGHPRKGPVISFTQAVMRRTAGLLPENPVLPGDANMRKALQDLAESRSKMAGRIRKARARA